MLTESDETAEEPRSHARKVILNIVRRGWAGVNVIHTFDWKVKIVKPKKTPKVINLQNNVNDLQSIVGKVRRTKLVRQAYYRSKRIISRG